MIDTLLYIFGPQIAEKLFPGNRSNLTVEEMAQALVDVADESNKHTEAIAVIQKELQPCSRAVVLAYRAHWWSRRCYSSWSRMSAQIACPNT
jgi:hypothetical protein